MFFVGQFLTIFVCIREYTNRPKRSIWRKSTTFFALMQEKCEKKLQKSAFFYLYLSKCTLFNQNSRNLKYEMFYITPPASRMLYILPHFG